MKSYFWCTLVAVWVCFLGTSVPTLRQTATSCRVDPSEAIIVFMFSSPPSPSFYVKLASHKSFLSEQQMLQRRWDRSNYFLHQWNTTTKVTTKHDQSTALIEYDAHAMDDDITSSTTTNTTQSSESHTTIWQTSILRIDFQALKRMLFATVHVVRSCIAEVSYFVRSALHYVASINFHFFDLEFFARQLYHTMLWLHTLLLSLSGGCQCHEYVSYVLRMFPAAAAAVNLDVIAVQQLCVIAVGGSLIVSCLMAVFGTLWMWNKNLMNEFRCNNKV